MTYRLAKRGKSICPECGKRTFVLYVDENDNPLNETVGKCDRADKCAFHKRPRDYFNEHPEITTERSSYHSPIPIKIEPKRPTYGDPERLKQSMTTDLDNHLITFFEGLFPNDTFGDLVDNLRNGYYIGSSDHWPGATVFWQIDITGHIRCGKIMQYNPLTGKRVKEPFNKINWVHSVDKVPDYNLSQCLFGEHLIRKMLPDDWAVIVESEKTALLVSAVFTDAVGLATGGCGSLNPKLCSQLSGHKVLIIPDNGKYQEWSDKANLLRGTCKYVSVSDIMERHATSEGDDIGDIIVESIRNKNCTFEYFSDLFKSANIPHQYTDTSNDHCLFR